MLREVSILVDHLHRPDKLEAPEEVHPVEPPHEVSLEAAEEMLRVS